jgi:hypothetical protein
VLSAGDWLLLAGALLVLILVGRVWAWTERRTPIGKLGSTLVPFLVAVLVALAVAVYVLARR